MLTLIRNFFVFLGVIFFLLLLAVAYLIVADPYNLRPLVSLLFVQPVAENAVPRAVPEVPSVEPVADRGETPPETAPPAPLSDAQTAALETVGIDAAALTNFTATQETCFVQIFGQARVDAIKGGAVPTASEFAAGQSCL